MSVKRFDLGNVVICDLCGHDFTNSDEQGGLTFGSKAVCPHCTPDLEEQAKKYNETHLIGKRCPEGMSFRNFVIEILRGGKPGYFEITTFDGKDDDIDKMFDNAEDFLNDLKGDSK